MDTPYQIMPDLTPEEYAGLKADIATRGIQVAVEYDDAGNILDGYHRVRAWEELQAEGVDCGEIPKVARSGMTEEQKRTHARILNVARRHLSHSQRQSLIGEQLKETPGRSDRQIAADFGVSPTTTGSIRHELAGC